MAGTLDPMATGVLPVFVGQATRGVSFAESGDKEYLAALRLGLVTNTQDTSGPVSYTHLDHPGGGIRWAGGQDGGVMEHILSMIGLAKKAGRVEIGEEPVADTHSLLSGRG